MSRNLVLHLFALSHVRTLFMLEIKIGGLGRETPEVVYEHAMF